MNWPDMAALRSHRSAGWSGDAFFSRLWIAVAARMLSSMNHWLVKQEPEDYSWADFVKDDGTAWTGVRNFQARNNLRAMKKGDEVLFYHSGSGKEIVGVARVARAAYPDSTARDGDWVCVDLKPVKAFKHPVPLATIKADALLKGMALVKQSRLSVMPVTAKQFDRVLKLGG